MKKPIIFILLFSYVILFATAPAKFTKGLGCVDNLGHMFYDIDSIHFDPESVWYVDTLVSLKVVDTSWYKVFLVKPSGDTIYFTCLKCDSVGYYIEDSLNIYQRGFVVRP
jgi:hypothetical protein